MDGNKKGAKKMSDEDRAKLIKKLDTEMEEYLASMEEKAKNNPTKYQDGWKEETWEKGMESHPFFAQNEALLEEAAKGKVFLTFGFHFFKNIKCNL